MGTPVKPAPASSGAPRSRYSLASPQQGPSLQGGPLRLPGGRGPWTYLISPAKLACRDGAIVPLPAKAWHEPGLNGNGKNPGRGEGFVLRMQSQGFIAIPHDFPASAFGAQRSVDPISTYLDRYEGIDAMGRPCVYYTDAWERPESLGHLIHWKRDKVGRDAFLVAALMALTGINVLSAVQIQIATTPLIDSIRSLFRARGLDAARHLGERIAHLPPGHIPPDVARIARAVAELDPGLA